jgi:hypothetical protein
MDFWEFFLAMTIILPIMVLWIGCIIDVVGRPDISGWKKAGWMLFIIFLPLIGSIIYAIVRPRLIDTRASVLDSAYSEEMRLPTAERAASKSTFTEPGALP